jgi:hypothetical protein
MNQQVSRKRNLNINLLKLKNQVSQSRLQDKSPSNPALEAAIDTFSSESTDIRGVTGLDKDMAVMQRIELDLLKYMNETAYQK